MSMNRVILLGNLTREPELKYTDKGVAVCEFGLAVNRKYKTKAGEDKEDTLFIECAAWDKQAESCGGYLEKGSQVLIEGRLKFDQWDDKQTGQKRSRITVTAERVQFLNLKGDKEEAPAQQQQGQPPPPFPESQAPAPAAASGFPDGN